MIAVAPVAAALLISIEMWVKLGGKTATKSTTAVERIRSENLILFEAPVVERTKWRKGTFQRGSTV